MKIIGLLFLLPLLLFSCKKAKDGPMPTSGQVVDKHTGAGVANATVSLMRNRTSSTSAAYSFVESWDTDENGHFDLNFEGDEDYSYILMASTPLGHYTSWQEAPRVTSGRKNKDVKVPAQAPAWVRVRLIDEEPKGFKILSIQGFKDDPYGYIYLYNDTAFIKRVDGGITSTIAYGLKESFNEVTQLQLKSVSPSPLDTTLLEIKF